MKDRKSRLSPKASQIIKSIGNNKNIITMDYIDNNKNNNNDCKIIGVAKQASENFNCKVDLITCDTGFTARLRGDETVQVLPLEKYMITKQNLIDINTLKKLNNYYADSYDDVERVLGIKIPTIDEINAYLSDGNTLIISVIRNKKKPMAQRKKKIQWLISHGADVNKRDCKKYYFPPLSHAIQNGDFEIFKFLLHECKANPNKGKLIKI